MLKRTYFYRSNTLSLHLHPRRILQSRRASRQRIHTRVSTPILPWVRGEANDMLVSQHSAVGEDEPCSGCFFFLGRAQLAGHFCQSVHAVVVSCSAERGEAAEEGDGGGWGEGEVVAG